MVIGIYGGVGSGKSVVLQYLKERYDAVVIGMDETAHALYEKGRAGYVEVLSLLGTGVLNPDQTLNRGKMAELLYKNPQLLRTLNARIHPLVYRETERRIREALPESALIAVETALPSPDGSDSIEEIWYVYTPKELRAERLRKNRGYTDARIREIMEQQPDDRDYAALSDWVLENAEAPEALFEKIDLRLAERGIRG